MRRQTPQVLVNVSGVDKDAVASSDAVTRAVEEAESALQGKGASAAASIGNRAGGTRHGGSAEC